MLERADSKLFKAWKGIFGFEMGTGGLGAIKKFWPLL